MTQSALHGRVALVTGAGRGIGREIAVGLADAGVHVALLARSTDQLEAVERAIHERGGTALALACDVGDPKAGVAAVRRADRELGAVDILINNAAVVWPLGPTPTLDPAEVTAALAINVVGPMALAAAVLPGMQAQGWGRVVNVSSAVVARPQAMVGGGAYAAGKAALEAHTLNLAEEVAGSGVTVNVYRPGSVDTAMQQWIRDQRPEEVGAALHERFTANHREGRLITPQRSAAALLERLGGTDTGMIWDVAVAAVGV